MTPLWIAHVSDPDFLSIFLEFPVLGNTDDDIDVQCHLSKIFQYSGKVSNILVVNEISVVFIIFGSTQVEVHSAKLTTKGLYGFVIGFLGWCQRWSFFLRMKYLFVSSWPVTVKLNVCVVDVEYCFGDVIECTLPMK